METPAKRTRPPSITLLFAMMYAGQLGSNIYLPGLPDIARDLNATLAGVQTMVAAYLVSFALAQLLMGPLSDRIGRRPVILGGLALFTVASVSCVFAPDIGWLLIARFVQAAGACATIVVSRAMVRDTAEGVAAAQAMAWLGIAIGVGPATAPFIGGLLTTWFGWQSTFYATALIAAGVLVAVVVNLEETLLPSMRNPPRASQLLITYLRLAANPVFTGYCLIVSFASGAMQAYLTSMPIVFIILMGVPPDLFGVYIMIMPTLYLIATYTARRLTAIMPIDRIVLMGVACSAGGGTLQVVFGLYGVTTPYPVLFAFAISNFGTGLVMSNCYAQALSTVPPSIAGSASALSGFMHMGWGAIVAFAAASLTHTSSLQFSVVQMTTTWLAAAAALILIFVVKRNDTGKGG